MKTEKELKFMLEKISNLNDLIEKSNEARIERDELRKQVSRLMEIYIETVEEMTPSVYDC